MSRPNIVLISTDQWRGDALGVAGNPDIHTPFLDDLATRGARFSEAYSPSPTCVPARMSMLTGLTPGSHRRVGYQDGVAFDVDTTIAGELGKAGYQTKAIGKMHVYPERCRAGFDDVELHDGYLHSARVRSRQVDEYDDYLPWLRERAGVDADYTDDGVNCNAAVTRPWGRAEALHPTNWIGTQFARWMYRRDPTAPFFAYLSFHRPHPPFDPPAWAFEMYRDLEDYQPVTADWDADYAVWRDDHRVDAHSARYDQLTLNRARAGYYGAITHIDGQINRIRELLHEFGHWDDTYILFTSDHGEMLGEHGLWHKGVPYEGSARVPFLLYGPDVPAGKTIGELVGLEDLMPTVLDLAGAPIPDSVDGRSVLPLLGGDSSGWRVWYHGEHTSLDRSIQWIRTPEMKYVWQSNTGREQLFDMRLDRQETTNCVDDAKYSVELGRLRQLLVDRLTGRPEMYVVGGDLVAGRTPLTLLP